MRSNLCHNTKADDVSKIQAQTGDSGVDLLLLIKKNPRFETGIDVQILHRSSQRDLYMQICSLKAGNSREIK